MNNKNFVTTLWNFLVGKFNALLDEGYTLGELNLNGWYNVPPKKKSRPYTKIICQICKCNMRVDVEAVAMTTLWDLNIA